MAWATPKTDWASSDAVSESDLNRIEGNAQALHDLLPAGMIMMWGPSPVPSGWLACDGSTFTSDNYPALAVLYPEMTVPDLRNRFIVGAGDEYSVADTGGEVAHTLTTAELPAHNHQPTPAVFDTEGETLTGMKVDKTTTGAAELFGAEVLQTQNVGSGNAHENRPPYYALIYIIRAI